MISFLDLKKTSNKITDNKKINSGIYEMICNVFKKLILIITLNKYFSFKLPIREKIKNINKLDTKLIERDKVYFR